jgi:hypothetical protein
MLKFDYRTFNLIDYDWCLMDKNGYLAIMMSGGQGGVPDFLAESSQEIIDAASQIISNSQVATEATIDIDDLKSTVVHLKISQKGFYVYDAMYDALNKYTRIAIPQNKLHISQISELYVDMLTKHRFDGVFQDSSII